MTSGDATGRRVAALATAGFEPYDLDGPLQPEITWQPISFDRASQQGSYVMRMAPGARTIAHDHPGYEDFLILEGELTDSDGLVLKRGDFVSYPPGSHHHSWTTTGCVIAVFEWRPAGPDGLTECSGSDHAAGPATGR
jgi:mannose-6-phosphate isomerase-like protein (cupin superfamily)